VTVGLLLVVRIGSYVPLPGVDFSSPALAYSSLTSYLFLFGEGIMPYFHGAIILLLLSGMIPPLRRLREGSPGQTVRFDQLILLVAMVITGVKTWYVCNALALGGVPTLSAPLAVLIHCAGLALLVWIASLITTHGIANGLALILLVDSIDWLSGIFAQFPSASKAVPSHPPWLLPAGLLALGLVAFSVALILTHRRIPLVPRSDRSVATGTVYVPLGVNAVGTMALATTLALLEFPAALATFGLLPPDLVPTRLGALVWPVVFALVIGVTYLLTAWGYSGDRLREILDRLGYEVPDVDRADLARFVERRLGVLIIPGIVVVCAMPAVTHWTISTYFETGSGGIFEMCMNVAIHALIVVAVILEVMRRIRARLEWGRMQAQVHGVDGTDDWLQVYQCDTELEAELVRDILDRHDVPATVQSARWMAAVGTLSLWTWSPARFPALMPHRRLGDGRVVVFAPATSAPQVSEAFRTVPALAGWVPDPESAG
jgi:preprotein translocase subunit SecY